MGLEGVASLGGSTCSRGIESVTPVPRAVGETLSDSRADTVQASMSGPGKPEACCEGGGTDE